MAEEVTTEVEAKETQPQSEVKETPTAQESGSSTNESSESGEEKGAAPAYVPDYKLKVYDQEKTLDDPFLKGLIKDAESEKKVKEIAQKYLGFEMSKEISEKVRNSFDSYKTQTQPIVEVYNQASAMLQKNDLESFFDLLKIPKEAVFKYAIQKAEEDQLPQESRMQLEQQRQLAREREYLQSQNQTLMSQQQQQLAQFRNQELSWVLARPDVSATVQAFDAKNGPGAFRQAVIDQGLAHHAITQGREDLSAEQATQKVLKMIGAFITPMNANGQQAVNQTQLIQQDGAPPIIPNISGRGTSPVKRQIRTIEDLKKVSAEMRDG